MIEMKSEDRVINLKTNETALILRDDGSHELFVPDCPDDEYIKQSSLYGFAFFMALENPELMKKILENADSAMKAAEESNGN